MRPRARSVLVRGIRWRLSGSLLVVITTAIAVGTAIVGPLFLRAASDSLVRQAVATANASNTSFELVPVTPGSTTLDRLAAEGRSLLARGNLARLYGPPVVETMLAEVALRSVTGHPYASQLTYRSGICSILHFRRGGCRTGPGDAVLSTRSAARLGVSVGSTITVRDFANHHPAHIHVTGLFDIPNLQSRYWFGNPGADFAFGQNTGKPFYLNEVDDLFVTDPGAFALPSAYVRSLTFQSGLRSGVLGVANASTVRQDLFGLEQRAARDGFEIETGLPSLLAGPLHQQRLMDTIVVPAALQLVLLAMWVLTSVLMRSADLRRSELRVARLRGFPPSTLLAVSITEPAALCAVGAVLGVLGGWIAVRLAAAVLLVRGSAVGPDAWTGISLAAVLLTIGTVLGLSSVRLLRSSGLAASAPPAATRRARAAIDLAILTFSVVALIAAATSGALTAHSNPVAVAAPALVALGTSVIAVRVVEYLCRRLSVITLDSSAVASFLAVRRIGRRPTALREGRTLVIAVGLACFAVSAWSVARANRITVARFSVGAPTVLTVTAHGRPLEQAVQAVDPRGRFAMAAIEISASGTSLIGVDAARLRAVAEWPPGTTPETIAAVSRALTPSAAPPVTLARGALAVTASVSPSGPVRAALGHLQLGAWLFDPADGTRIVDLGRLHSGSFTYAAGRQSGCPCRLVGFGVLADVRRITSAGEIRLGLSALTPAGDHSSAEVAPANWHASASGVRIISGGRGVGFEIPMSVVAGDIGPYEGQSPVMASLGDLSAALPAVAGRGAESLSTGGSEGTLPVQGLDGNNLTVRLAVIASSLPRIGSDGVIVDLGALERAQTGPTFASTSDQVWLGPAAPSDAIGRLRAAGLRIDQVQRSSTLIAQGRQTGPALAYDFMLLATLVAVLVAAVGTFSVLAAGGRGRATEMLALEVTGVRRAILVRSLGLEAGILALTALFGVAAGAGTAAITLPALPRLADATDAPLSYGLPVLLLLAVAVGAVLVVMIATALAARGILMSMSPSLLRTGADDVD